MSKSCLVSIKEKALTRPRLDIQSAVVSCRMKNAILEEVTFKVKSVYFWCDSKTVIYYLKNDTTNFAVNIALRANEIRWNSRVKDWDYIPKKLNVADELTTFTSFQNLTNQSR